MKKTDNFFVIHNYNTVPGNLLEYCKDYIIYDASDDNTSRKEMDNLGIKYLPIENTGHNITSYFTFFAEHYDDLPETMCLLKGNIIGRHLTKDYFEKVYDFHTFTYLYEDKDSRRRYEKRTKDDKPSIAYLVDDNMFLEQNTSWYVNSPNHPHKYFSDFDQLLTFIYKDPVIPQYCLFAPGACYIVSREQVRRNSKVFYQNINMIMNYGLNPSFPSEAHQIERMLPIILNGTYEVNDWMNSVDIFHDKLLEREHIIQKQDEWNQKRFKRIRRLFKRGSDIV